MMARERGIRAGGGAITIPADAIEWQFVRSSGPGGQHVNRTSSKAVLRFDARRSPHLPEDVRRRLLEREKPRLTRDGFLVITSQRHRDQPKNVADCLAKLSALIERAVVVPKVRRRTKTPRGAMARRLDEKRRRSATKRLRGRPQD
jgi:ribosome-associated protein